MRVTYKKLSNGDWGVRAEGVVKAGEFVTVTKKSGSTKQEKIQHVLWTGNGVSICAIERNNAANWKRRSSRKIVADDDVKVFRGGEDEIE